LKKYISIFFFITYLLSATEAHQFFKLPVIFQHYSEHKAEDNSISLLQFLAMHYLHGSPKDKDYARDMQLPFKTSGDCLSSIAPAFVPALGEFSIEIPLTIFKEESSIPQLQFILSAYLSNIWQPPKI
jgi:hypothetical protein